MSDNNQISGKWQGTYSQKLKEDPEDDQIFEVDFEMKLECAEDGFTGTCYDLEIESGKKEKSSISGFIEDKMISFIKRYEHSIYLDEHAEEFVLDKGATHSEIHYYGTFNSTENKFEGTWEIEIEKESVGSDQVNTSFIYGSWWMKFISP